ncbi:NYN domain-containing protein [Tuberibacillus calidus]|jgi:hypothetical protein|uniref:NYN domain-containing protein n=1 Tax=Tuberibacillus calidus TaxID=340097 RepID=UPI0003FE4601|nr:NYN domain-containing protein [Tuberibacillus calidus]
MNVLLVDAYNIIGAWPDLKKLKEQDFEAARDRLIEYMAEYQAYTGFRVIVIFDAHMVPGAETRERKRNVEVVYTREKETADECIEKLVSQIKDVQTTVYVATSDYVEQWTVFSQGALRKSARELYREMKEIENQIAQKIEEKYTPRKKASVRFNEEIIMLFEKWRRGK